MKSKGITDLYLPSKVAYHVKVLLGSVLTTTFFSLMRGINPINREFPQILLLIFVQFEIYIWIGSRFFNIEKSGSAGEFLRKTFLRLVVYYLIVLVIASIIVTLYIFIIFKVSGANLYDFFPNLIHRESKGFIVAFAGGILFGTLIFFFFQWFDALKREQKLKEEKLIFRYETLKNQVRPHFLFNSLNTLSSLVDGNDHAEKFIQKLSGIYRYMLDNIDRSEVSLAEEIKFARDYFYLQQIRDEKKIMLEIKGIPEREMKILPFSIQILIENALKHNSATREQPLTIRLFSEGRYIIVSNNLQKKLNLEESMGIGLKNLGERIRLATGKDLIIESGNNEFTVKLPLLS